MSIRDLLAIFGVAGATMAFTLGLLAPGHVSADGEAKTVKPTIAQPKLTVDGCQFTLTTDKPAYGPGEMPVLTVVATNTTDKPVSTSVNLSISATSPASMASRRLILPTNVWTDRCVVNLEPGQMQIFTFETNVKLPAGGLVSITMFGGEQAVIADRLRVLAAGNSGPANQAVQIDPDVLRRLERSLKK